MSLEALLEIQTHDSAIDRLRYRRQNLVEFTALAECDAERTHVETQRAETADRRHGLERDQKRLEDEAALIQDRRDSDNERLYSGSVTAHKDLQALQAELEVLAERQSGIEDEILEVMEAIEPLDAQIAGFDAQLEEIGARRGRIESAIVAAEQEIDREIDSESRARDHLGAGIDSDLLAVYEQTRAACGGIGVSRLVNKTCEGCHLELPAVEIDRIRKEPADARINCECGRILVRV